MSDVKGKIQIRIDKDEGLRSKRRMLTITSLIFLAIQFSGAQISEINAYIFKLKFSSQNGIQVFLLAAIIFLLIRYYSYARSYHSELKKLWFTSMLASEGYFSCCDYSGECGGILYKKADSYLNLDALGYDEHSSYEGHEYVCKILLRRYFRVHWIDGGHENSKDFNVLSEFGLGQYFLILANEIRYQFKSFLIDRENMDIVSPYLFGILALLSFFFVDQLHSFLAVIASKLSL